MPKLTHRVKDRLAELDWSVRDLAALTDIPPGTMKNAVSGIDEMRIGRVHTIARVLDLAPGDIVQTDADYPDEPPPQPKNEPRKPARRKDVEKRQTGPKRVASESRAA